MIRYLLLLHVIAWPLLAVAAEPVAQKTNDKAPAQQGEKPKLAVTISNETTFITEPLGADGYPDYYAALDRAAREGVTTKNNALIMLYQALGPELAGRELTPAYYKKLGLRKFEEDEQNFVTWEKYIEAMTPEFLPPATAEEIAESNEYENPDDVRESLIRTRLRLQKNVEHPWKSKDYPHLSAWLNDMAPHLDLARQVAQRKRYYDPSMTVENANPYYALPEYFHALTQRALRDAGEERWDAAWEQATALLTLGERLANVPDRFQHENATDAYQRGFRTARTLAFDTRVGMARLQRWNEELAKLQIPSTERCYTWTERLLTLHRIVELSKHKERPKNIGFMGESPPWHERYSLHEAYDFDQALRLVNVHFDQIEKGYQALQKNEPTRFLGEMNKAHFDYHKFYSSHLGKFLLKDVDRQQRTETLAKMYQLSPQYTFIETVEQEYKTRTWLNLTRIQFALQLYRLENGRFPEKLDALAPKYFNKLPLDYDTDKQAYRYKTNGKGLLLYGLGPDGNDSGGQNTLNNHHFFERHDDMAVFTADHEPK